MFVEASGIEGADCSKVVLDLSDKLELISD